MLGELCAACLWKYVLAVFIGSGRWLELLISRSMEWRACAHERYFIVALLNDVSHNYKDIHGNEFTSARAPSAGLERTGRHPSAPAGCDRPTLSRQRILRSERSRAGQVRDAAQRPEGKACSSGGGPSLWPVPPGLLCHSTVVSARGATRAAAAQARAETTPQAQRRSADYPGPGYTGSRTNAQGRGISGASGAALWRRSASAQYPAAAASLSAAGGKKTPIIVEAAKLDATQYTVQYELLRSQIISTTGNVAQGNTAGQLRGIGLALMLSEGMAGWLKTVEAVLRASLAPRALDSSGPSSHDGSP